MQGTSAVFVDKMPTFRVFRKVHFVVASELSAVYQLHSQVLGIENAHFKVGINKLLKYTHFFSVDELCSRMVLYTLCGNPYSVFVV